MAWFKVDDRLHHHRKARKVRRSHPEKSRDAAPFGLWVLAGSWCGTSGTNGFVPREILLDFDDNADELAARLVDAGMFIADTVEGDEGFWFHDYEHMNPTESASASALRGNHVRWHANRGVIDPNCDFCVEDDASDSSGRIGANRGDGPDESDDNQPDSLGNNDISPNEQPKHVSAGQSGSIGGESGAISGGIALPVPSRTRPVPVPDKNISRADDFARFWQSYPKRIGKGQALKAWKAAVKKANPDAIIAAAGRYAEWTKTGVSDPKFIAHPSTWLNGERWDDDLPRVTQVTSTRQSETDALFGRALERAKAKEMNQ